MEIDGRTLDHKTLEHLRITACRRVAEGEQPSAEMRSMGLCRTTIYKWLRVAKGQGVKALASRKAAGPSRRLTAQQRANLKRWIVTKDPRDFGFIEALWSRPIIQSLLLDKFKITLSLSAIGRMLKFMGITPQKPLRRAYERNPAEIKEWVEVRYPKIAAKAKRTGALILFLDEAGFKSDPALGRSFGLKGKTPIVQTSGQRQKVNAVSAVSPLGEFRFALYTCRFNAELFIEILKRFTKGMKRRCYFIVDGHPAHRANAVRDFIKASKGKLELHFLPPYAPDLNPDEFCWGNAKTQGLSKIPLKQNESLKELVRQDLLRIQNDKKLIRSFFKAPSVAYAAH